MGRYTTSVALLLEKGMDNVSFAMTEERVTDHAIRTLDYTERVCRDAFADGQVTHLESRKIRNALALLRADLDHSLALDRKDLANGQLLNKDIQALAR